MTRQAVSVPLSLVPCSCSWRSFLCCIAAAEFSHGWTALMDRRKGLAAESSVGSSLGGIGFGYIHLTDTRERSDNCRARITNRAMNTLNKASQTSNNSVKTANKAAKTSKLSSNTANKTAITSNRTVRTSKKSGKTSKLSSKTANKSAKTPKLSVKTSNGSQNPTSLIFDPFNLATSAPGTGLGAYAGPGGARMMSVMSLSTVTTCGVKVKAFDATSRTMVWPAGILSNLK